MQEQPGPLFVQAYTWIIPNVGHTFHNPKRSDLGKRFLDGWFPLHPRIETAVQEQQFEVMGLESSAQSVPLKRAANRVFELAFDGVPGQIDRPNEEPAMNEGISLVESHPHESDETLSIDGLRTRKLWGHLDR